LLLLYLFFFLNFLLFVLFTLTSLFSYSYSYPFHFPSFCCATIHCSPSQLLFLPLLIHAFPLSLSHHPSSTCYHTIPPSYTITTHWLAYCSHHQPPAILDTSTLHNNSGNIP
jgi:hypothetical protein